MKAKFVFEKFEKDSDPIKDMGIGSIKNILSLLAKFLEEELSWNGARVIQDDNELIYTCFPGNSVIPDIKKAIEKFGLGGKLNVKKHPFDFGSRSYDDGAIEHMYIISIKKTPTRKKV